LTDQRDENQKDGASGASDAVKSRRTYVPPELVEYGNVAKLTQGGGVTVMELVILMQMGCL
jgi:hypothetical protein